MKNENSYPVPTYWMELNSLDTQKCVSVVSTHLHYKVTRNWVEHTLCTMIATAKVQGLKPHIASSQEYSNSSQLPDKTYMVGFAASKATSVLGVCLPLAASAMTSES